MNYYDYIQPLFLYINTAKTVNDIKKYTQNLKKKKLTVIILMFKPEIVIVVVQDSKIIILISN